jgi:predicted Zn-dependent protease
MTTSIRSTPVRRTGNPPDRPRRGLAAASTLLVVTCVAILGACAVNPVTGRTQLVLISESQEIEIGRSGAQGIEAQIGVVPDTALQSYMHALGTRMATASERPVLPWRFGVLDDPTPNAFALPGGFIYVTRGLLAIMDSEAQLATVVGHEIGHVTARHSVVMISRAQVLQLGLGLGMVFLPGLERFGGLAGTGLELLFLSYGRDAERQADDLGFTYALGQGYDVREMPAVFAALQRVGQLEGRSPLPSWLSSHPNPEERIGRIEQQLAQLELPPTGLTIGRDAYLQRLEGLVYGVNPRHGFFRDGLFLHPDLAFQLRFPQGWPTQNMAQAVVAVSTQRDAAVQLTIAAAANPDDALRTFAAQQGVRVLQSARRTINGLPAAVAEFAVQTQQGEVRGIVTFIAHGGRVFQVLGYSPAQRFGAYSSLFQQVAGTFAPLTDPQVLGVQPNRLRLVRLPRAMTLAEFNAQYPSVIPMAELALINQVPGPDAVLPANGLVKRVAN